MPVPSPDASLRSSMTVPGIGSVILEEPRFYSPRGDEGSGGGEDLYSSFVLLAASLHERFSRKTFLVLTRSKFHDNLLNIAIVDYYDYISQH